MEGAPGAVSAHSAVRSWRRVAAAVHSGRVCGKAFHKRGGDRCSLTAPRGGHRHSAGAIGGGRTKRTNACNASRHKLPVRRQRSCCRAESTTTRACLVAAGVVATLALRSLTSGHAEPHGRVLQQPPARTDSQRLSTELRVPTRVSEVRRAAATVEFRVCPLCPLCPLCPHPPSSAPSSAR